MTDVRRRSSDVRADERADPHALPRRAPGDGGGVVVRAFRPGRASDHACCRGRRPRRARAVHRGGVFEGVVEGAELPLDYELEVATGRRHVHAPRPVRVPADARRARPPPGRRGPPRGALRRSSARTCARSTASPAPRSRSGRRTRASVSVVGDFNGWDGRLHPMRSLGASGIWELFVPGVGDGHALQVRDPHAGRRAPAEGRPVRVRAPRCRRRPRRSCIEPEHEWRDDDVDGARARARAARAARCRSTRCTSARGG